MSLRVDFHGQLLVYIYTHIQRGERTKEKDKEVQMVYYGNSTTYVNGVKSAF